MPKEKGLSAVGLDKTIVHGGTRAIRIQGHGNRGIVCQTITTGFTPGDTLRLTGWVRRENPFRGEERRPASSQSLSCHSLLNA